MTHVPYCCSQTVNEIMRKAQDPEERLKRKYMIEKYGHILSIIEIKDMAVKEGKSFREKYEELGMV